MAAPESTTSSSSSSSESLIEAPNRFDILCGKGKECNSSEGSQRYRLVIDSYRHRYAQALTRHSKCALTLEIYELLSKTKSRFLKYNEKLKGWEELPFMTARDKIGHALRFANRKVRKEVTSAAELGLAAPGKNKVSAGSTGSDYAASAAVPSSVVAPSMLSSQPGSLLVQGPESLPQQPQVTPRAAVAAGANPAAAALFGSASSGMYGNTAGLLGTTAALSQPSQGPPSGASAFMAQARQVACQNPYNAKMMASNGPSVEESHLLSTSLPQKTDTGVSSGQAPDTQSSAKTVLLGSTVAIEGIQSLTQQDSTGPLFAAASANGSPVAAAAFIQALLDGHKSFQGATGNNNNNVPAAASLQCPPKNPPVPTATAFTQLLLGSFKGVQGAARLSDSGVPSASLHGPPANSTAFAHALLDNYKPGTGAADGGSDVTAPVNMLTQALLGAHKGPPTRQPEGKKVFPIVTAAAPVAPQPTSTAPPQLKQEPPATAMLDLEPNQVFPLNGGIQNSQEKPTVAFAAAASAVAAPMRPNALLEEAKKHLILAFNQPQAPEGVATASQPPKMTAKGVSPSPSVNFSGKEMALLARLSSNSKQQQKKPGAVKRKAPSPPPSGSSSDSEDHWSVMQESIESIETIEDCNWSDDDASQGSPANKKRIVAI